MKRCILIIVLVLTTMPAIWAQGCSVCTKTASGLGDKAAKGLNGGIIYLAFAPLTLLGTIGYIWWRHNKNN